MKHIRLFEAYKTSEEMEKERQEKVELLQDLINENPLHVDHDFYVFIGRPEFKENEDGKYTKYLEIEKMYKINPNTDGLYAMNFMKIRARSQGNDSEVYHIWLPKELENEVSGKSSNNMDPWLIYLIDEHKQKDGDDHGKKVYKDVLKRKADANKYNL